TDVLTFYQERIVNEGFLRTATQRRSVLEMARAIGYELKPGVAASTYLIFTLEDAKGAPGIATIDEGTRVLSIPGQNEKPQVFETIEAIEGRVEWNALKPRMTEPLKPGLGAKEVYLSGVDTGLKPGDGLLFIGDERKLDLSSERWDFRRVQTVTTDQVAGYTKVTWDEGLGWKYKNRTILPAEKNLKIFSFGQRAALFGYNAPDFRAMADTVKKAYLMREPTINDTEWPDFKISSTDTIYLDSIYKEILPDSWLVLTIPEYMEIYQAGTVAEDSQSNFTISAKTTRVTLKGENLDLFNDKLRETVVFAQSQLLEMAEVPISTHVSEDSITLDCKIENLSEGQLMVVSGKNVANGEDVSEIVTLSETEDVGDSTKIVFSPALANSYQRDTVTINANVVRATHGETVSEVLGSGNAGESYQKFLLKKAPLTYVSASTPNGTLSTLGIHVDGVLCQEAQSFFNLDSDNRSYIVRIDDDSKTHITFGDGKKGARLPTGIENITATYRNGIGPEGEVSAGSLTLLQSRPPGIRSVTNPLAASGAESPEQLSDARRNAPVTVQTLDRIVSLKDYENLARSFAGISKAQAQTLHVGQSRLVHITVAAASGSEVESKTYDDLCNAIDSFRDLIESVKVDGFQHRTFSIDALLIIDKRYFADDVKSQVEAYLIEVFSFDNRDFGQPVSAAEVFSVMQSVEGVIAIDLNKLELDNVESDSVSSTTILSSKKARVEDEKILQAELLLLDPEGLKLRWVQNE
ncbi:MAG TPA: putative baseplate assembly protein, partial [Candidatus Nanoarchaeia archaeon]|nr:putative baseplate assembly protein [Candidatus Nanoarchaeia archaeon]